MLTVKKQVVKMLIRNCGLRDIEFIAGVHRKTTTRILEKQAWQLSFPHRKSSYDLVELDELYSFVGSKKNKQWLLYAYAPEAKEVPSWQWGDRSQQTVELLYKQLDELQILLRCVAC